MAIHMAIHSPYEGWRVSSCHGAIRIARMAATRRAVQDGSYQKGSAGVVRHCTRVGNSLSLHSLLQPAAVHQLLHDCQLRPGVTKDQPCFRRACKAQRQPTASVSNTWTQAVAAPGKKVSRLGTTRWPQASNASELSPGMEQLAFINAAEVRQHGKPRWVPCNATSQTQLTALQHTLSSLGSARP